MPQVIAYAVAYIAGPAAIAASTVLTFAGYAITVAAVAGFSASQKRKAQRKARDAYNASLQDRLVMTSTTDGPRSRVYGRTRNVDGVVFKMTHGTNSEFYTLVISVAGHEVDAIEEVYFNEVPVELDANGYVLTAPWGGAKPVSGQEPLTVSSGSGNVTLPHTPISGTVSVTITTGSGDLTNSQSVAPSVVGSNVSVSGAPVDGTWTVNYQYSQDNPKARVRKYLGGPAQDLSADLIALVGGAVTSTDRFANDATLLCTFEYDQDAFPTGLPNVTAVLRGAKCYDRRTGLTEWTQNPAVIADDWAQYANGGGCESDEVIESMVIAAANACDVSTTFTLADGTTETRPLYECGIACRLDADPRDTMDEIVEAMAGQWCWSGGRVAMRAGVHRAPVATIDSTWLSDTKSMQVIPQTATRELVNIMRPTIYDAAQNYVPTPTAPVRFTAAITADGRELPAETEFRGVTHAVHAQHVAGVQMRERREGLALSMPLNLKGLALEVFDVVEVDLPTFGFDGKQIETVGWGFGVDAGVPFTGRETASGIYDPDPNFDQITVSPNTALPDPSIVEQVTGLDVDTSSANLQDKSILVRALVSWDPVVGQAVRQSGRIEVQWIEASATLPAGDWPGRAEAEGNASDITVSGLRAGVHYLFRARARTTLGVRGKWSDQVLAAMAAAPKAAEVYQDDFDFAGTNYTSGGVKRTFTATPTTNCTVEFSATLICEIPIFDNGTYMQWRVDDGTTVTVLGNGYGIGSGSSNRVQVNATASFSAVGGVALDFETRAVNPTLSQTWYESQMRVTFVYR